MPDLEQVVPYLPSLNETEQEPPAAMAEMPEVAPAVAAARLVPEQPADAKPSVAAAAGSFRPDWRPEALR